MLKIVLLAGCAGFLGTVLRFGIVSLLPGENFPWGTLAVNLAGSFAAGFCFGYLKPRFPQYEIYFPVLFIGFFGAFTTFSTFMLDGIRLLQDGNGLRFALNFLLQNAGGLAAAALGWRLAKIV